MSVDIIITLLALIFSAFFSAYEISFLSCNRLRVELDNKQGKRYALSMDYFIKHPDKMLSTLLMGNNVALVIYGISIANLLNPPIEKYITSSVGISLAIETVIATLIVLFTAEFLPKALGRLNPNGVFKHLYRVILFFHYLLYPLTAAATFISKMIIKMFGIKDYSNGGNKIFDKTDLIYFADEIDAGEDKEDDFSSDMQIFKNALNLSNIKLRECMIPRTEVAAIDVEESREDLLQLFVDSGYSRILVFKENIDNIIGYVHSKDLFKGSEQKISEMLRPIDYVSEEMSAQSLLPFLTKNRKSIVVVKDEYGGTSGIVTLEDLIEEIFGDIDDELDKDEFVEKQINDFEYVFSARLEIKEINRKYSLDLPENDDYETLSGLILYNLESIPEEKDVVQLGKYSFTILKKENNRIITVLVKITKNY